MDLDTPWDEDHWWESEDADPIADIENIATKIRNDGDIPPEITIEDVKKQINDYHSEN